MKNVVDMEDYIKIIEVFKKTFDDFIECYGLKHSERIREKILTISKDGKISKSITWYKDGNYAHVIEGLGLFYSSTSGWPGELTHELWHIMGGKSLEILPERYKEKLENLQENSKSDYVKNQLEMWTEWFNSQTHRKDMKNNFTPWQDEFFTKSVSTGLFYDYYINIADMISCIIPREKLLEMYLHAEDYKTDYSYSEMLDELDRTYTSALDESERNIYQYPYLKIIMDINEVSKNIMQGNTTTAREVLQDCMKTCFNVYSIKLDNIREADIDKARQIYSEIKYMQEQMMWNTDLSKMQDLDYVQAMQRIQDKFRSILKGLNLQTPEIENMLETIDYTVSNPYTMVEDANKIVEKRESVINEVDGQLINIGEYQANVGTNGIKYNLYKTLFYVLNEKYYSLLFENFQDADNGNILLEFYNKIEMANTEQEVIEIYNEIYQLYAQKLERTLKTDENLALLFDSYSEEIAMLQKLALFNKKTKTYLPSFERIIDIYNKKVEEYEKEIDASIEKEVQKYGLADFVRKDLMKDANDYKKDLRKQQSRINIQREEQALEFDEIEKKGQVGISIQSLKGDISTSKVGMSEMMQVFEGILDVKKIENIQQKKNAGQELTEQEETTTSTIDDSQLEIDNDTILPNLPSFFPIEHDEDADEAIRKEKEKFLHKKLAKFGITGEEWEEIEKYKLSEYFLPTTLLHRIDLFKYNVPRYGDIFNNEDWLFPEKAIDSYCKIYSAMCKFGKRYNKELQINRVGSNLFYDEMKKTGQTQSMLSFSKGTYQFMFAADKNGVILSNGILERGTPCIDFTELTGKDGEDEILLPPFLNINYDDNETLVYDAYPEYNVHISPNNSQKLSEEERGKMELLRQSITGSNIPYDYYMHWYNTVMSNPSHQGDDEESVRLKQEFFKWQDEFKEYLQLRFREIENEINYPQLKPTDFLSWGIQRGQTGVERFKGVMQQVGDFFKQITNPLKEDGQDR